MRRKSLWLWALQWRSGERQVWALPLPVRRQSPWLRALPWRSGERQVWVLPLPAPAVFVTADVGACVGSGLTPCSAEVVALESVPFEGMGSGSSEHPVSRMASTAVLTSRPMIDFDIDFTSLTSLS